MGTRDEAIAVTKSMFVTIATQVVMNVLSFIPAGGAFGWFIKSLIEKFFGWMSEQGEIAAFFKYIDMRVGQQSQEFQDAALINWRLKQNGATKEEQRAAELDLYRKFKSFVVLTS